MAAKPTSYLFEGRTSSFPELAKQFSGYGATALRAYLNAGARTHADLVVMEADARRRRLEAVRRVGARRPLHTSTGARKS